MKQKILVLIPLLFLGIGTALGQTIKAKGTVIDENNQPVPTATVRLKKDAKKGTFTDMSGNFVIEAEKGDIIIISFVGYKNLEVKAKADLGKLMLQPDNELLDEVVVTAMGISRSKKSIGYAAQEIKAEDLLKTRQTDVNNALVGKVSGVRFLGGSGSNFDAGTIVLRGTSSLYDPVGSEPIYVIDGVITNKNALNMDDVESINVLKGPAATSLYGSQGGNGAIIVTTKRAKDGQSTVSISHTTTFEMPVIHAKVQKLYGGGYGFENDEMPVFHYDPTKHDPGLKTLDGARYYDYGDDASWGPKFDGKPYIPYYAWDPADPRYGQTAPWEFGMNLKDLYRTGVNNTTNISFAKGGKDYNTRISFTNVQRQGVNYNSDAVRRHLNVKSSFDVTKKLKVSLDWKYTYRMNKNTASEGYGDFGSFLQEFLQWGNTNVNINDLKAYDRRPDGSYPTWNINGPSDLTGAYHSNPFAIMNYANKTDEFQWNVFSANADYQIIDGLNVGINVNGNLRSYLHQNKRPEGFVGQVSLYRNLKNRIIDMQGQAYAKYSNRFVDDRLTFDAMLFSEMRSYDFSELDGYTKDGLIIDGFYNLNGSRGNVGAENEIKQWKTQSVFGTATLGFDDIYYLDLNIRNDWTSTLHPDHNSFLYGGLSGSILLSSLIKQPWLSFWKIRGSMAQVGSTMDAYNIYPTVEINDRYGQTVTMRGNRILNDPDIKPTISNSWEVGTEIRMLKGRLYSDLNFYRKDSKNQIIAQTVVGASGYTSQRINAGLIRNQGIEFTIGGTPVQTKDFVWDLNFNISKNKNTLVELYANDVNDDSYRISWFGFNTRIYSYAQEGKPIGIIRGTDWARDDKGNMMLKKKSNGTVSPMTKTSDDQIELGIAQPDFTGGFSTSLNYKNLSLAASLDFSVGGKIASTTNLWMMGSGTGDITAETNGNGKNVRDPLADGGGLFLEGVDAETGAPLSGYTNGRSYYEDYVPRVWSSVVYDATYVKLREVSLSYRFDRKLLDKLGLGLTSASISLVAQNPWLIYCSVPNIDASETVGSYSSFLETGQAVSTRTFGATVSLTF